MITQAILEDFTARVRGQALREGTRFATQARVHDFVGTPESVETVVRGRGGDYEVTLWSGTAGLEHRCSCPSWRNRCKHAVAAALVLRQWLARRDGVEGGDGAGDAARATDADGEALLPDAREVLERLVAEQPDPAEARTRALEERVAAGRRERLDVTLDEPPFLRVSRPSGFAYRVELRGTDAGGPHGCDCPDFEANRLHTCKHVERVRRYLAAPRTHLPEAHARDAERARVFLHFGEVVEPRLHGVARGPGARALNDAFAPDGTPLGAMRRDARGLAKALASFEPRVEPEARAWVERRLERVPALPRGDFRKLVPRLALEPYPYQWQGAEFLARRGRALLADEMGLGKTVQAIVAAAALRRARNAPARCVTVVCPASLRGGWADEIERWLGEEAVLVEGDATRRRAIIASRPRWLITHYEQVLRDFEIHAEHAPDLLVLDEAQRAKGLATRTARVLKAIDSRYLFALTGTPLENRLEEAYAIAQLVDQRLLPPLWQLDRDHFVREDGRRVAFYRNLGELRARLAPAFLRRRKEDVALELPERVRSVSFLPMHPDALPTHTDMMDAVARIARKKVLLPADVERMQRLLVVARRCCDGPHMLGLAPASERIPKLDELDQLLGELCLGEGRKAVVFSEWTDMTDAVEERCRKLGLPVHYLKGSVPVRQRRALIRAFSEHAGPAVFLSTDAGGVGLNLQAADVVVNLDLPWNPAKLEQRIARVHRIGSHETVREILLVTKDSVEENILYLHDLKRNVLDNVWASDGDDVVAAPGGSGAFREMIEALLATQAPEDAVDAGGGGHAAAEPAPHEHVPASAPARSTPAPRAASAPDVAESASAAGLDPATLARAVAAVAPALPAEHRQSLATVFRALADALDDGPG